MLKLLKAGDFINILLISGHSSATPGASSVLGKEHEEAINVVKKLQQLLKCDIYPIERNANNDYKNNSIVVDFKKYDMVLEIHFNAAASDIVGNGLTTGTEIFITNNSTFTDIPTKIVNNVSELGLKNRGLKRTDWNVIYHAEKQGVNACLFEVCFIDDKDDMDIYYSKFDDICLSIAKAIDSSISDVDHSNLTKIEGESIATVEQMRKFLISKNSSAIDIFGDLPYLYYNEGVAENIRGDVAFAQACLETGYFKFGGDVLPSQNNFCGLGATGGGAAGNSFASSLIGIMAQIQHLKAYSSKDSLYQVLVDPRFMYVERGVSPYVEWLGQKENPLGKGWATDSGYGSKILAILDEMLNFESGNNAESAGTENSGSWADSYIKEAVKLGISDGSRPKDVATREEVMAMCVNMYEKALNDAKWEMKQAFDDYCF